MKKYIIVTFIVFSFFGAYSQRTRTISLQQAETLIRSKQPVPDDVEHIYDSLGRLEIFKGVWKGSYGGRTYELRLKKITSQPVHEDDGRLDMLIGRVLIKDSATGHVLMNTLDSTDNALFLAIGYMFSGTSYNMRFGANSSTSEDCYDEGDIFIHLGKTDFNKMTLRYYLDRDLVDPDKCPGGLANYRTLLPLNDDLILYRQGMQVMRNAN